ncbi:hypothetical protein ACFYU9_24695 [Streptomyces sp. NPDC004327]|uniref:hypothetical protein n=1 Tax=unclassified Streptomyces TaxID=2593676 RepID=UPI0036787105
MNRPATERLGLHIKRVEQELTAAKHTALRSLGLTVPQVRLTDEGRLLPAQADAKAVAIERHTADGFGQEERALLIDLPARVSGRLTTP